MTEIKRYQEVDPFSGVQEGSIHEEIEFTTSKCITCGDMGPWVRVVRDKDGRIQEYSTFDVDHYAATGGKKGKGHNTFHHLTLKRNYAKVYVL